MCALCGCVPHTTAPPAPNSGGAGREQSDTLAPGVVHRAIPIGPDAGVDLIDVDTARAHATLSIVTDGLRSAHGRTFGVAHTPAEWQTKTHALACVNGGYFGELNADGRTEIMGLLAQNGKVRHAATVPHAALLLDAKGRPQIAWASSQAGRVVLSDAPFPRPPPWRQGEGSKNNFLPLSRSALRVASADGGGVGEGAAFSAVGCGPMLVWNGQVHVTDKQERLVSPGARARTFVAVDSTGQHVVFGMASGAEYTSLAAFLVHYFTHYDRTTAGRAFCLDGGSSTQLTYKLADGPVQSPRQTGAAMPDALVLMGR